MKAALVTRYGPPSNVHIGEIPKPVPKAGEVLIRVQATTVTAADWRIRSADVPRGYGTIIRLIFGWSGPRRPVLGTELAGVVEAVGEGVSRFAPGDEVFAATGMAMGAHAEYVAIRETGTILPIPPGFSMAEAAAICFGGLTSLFFLQDKARVQPGEHVLIVGAAGGVGSAAVELAKHYGAKVTGVCSAANEAFVRSLGADDVIDYQTTDFTRNGQRYDVIMDCAGTAPYDVCKDSLAPGGRLLLVVATLGQMLAAPLQSLGSIKVMTGTTPETAETMARLAALCAQGAFRPRIGETFAFERIAEAHALVESKHKRANAVVTL
jgi:NADPH:quinone reductase-like Zn-dependent oxidoreductase